MDTKPVRRIVPGRSLTQGSLDVRRYKPRCMDVATALPWLRVLTLVICLSLAAYSDYSSLMVRDRHWLVFSIPVSALLVADLALMETTFSNYFMVLSLIAAASLSIFSPPNYRNYSSWNNHEKLLAILLVTGLLGLFVGAYQNIEVDFLNLILGDEDEHKTLWWTLLSAILVILILLSSWHVGVIQGGADVKALILLTVLMPSWKFLPPPLVYESAPTSGLPPTFVIFLWASAAFIIAPPILMIQNAINGKIESLSDMKMAWHATKKPLRDIGEKPVWILTEILRSVDGSDTTISNRILPSRNSSSPGELSARIAELEEHGVEYAWVASKHPFIAYLFVAIIPLVLFGDPLAIILN